MGTESFLVTALPYSADPRSDFHVSLFVTHRLTPADPDGDVLAAFPNVAEWGERVATATVTLEGSDGDPIPVTPLAQVVPQLWPRVFPGDLPVRDFPTPELADVAWRTFPASRMDGHARALHMAAATLSPVEQPSFVDVAVPFFLQRGAALSHGAADGGRPTRQQLKAQLETLLTTYGRRLGEGDPRGSSVIRRLELLDEWITAQLDDLTAGGTVMAQADSPLEQLMVDLHLARRFYERPEEQRAYRERPLVPPPALERPPRPEPDFHQRCTFLADTPGVLRELGLVIDLHVDDLTRLDGLTWIRGDVRVEGLDNGVRQQPMVTCDRVGTAFSTRPAGDDYAGGALRLGDEDRYQVLDLDPDATGLKLERFTRSVPRLAWTEFNGDAANAAPSSLRAAGFSIARTDRAAALRERVADAAGRNAALLAGQAEPLRTEDVTRGLRLEVWDDASEIWRSLHERLIDLEVDGTVVFDDEEDTGFLQGAAVTRADESVSADPQRPYHAHEVVAGWEGWSLSVPPLGLTVTDETQPPGDQPDETHVTPVVVRPKIKPGSLTPLRYGRSYAFRAWGVDLAGNSPPAAVDGVGPSGGAGAGPRALAAAAARAAAVTAGRGRIGPGFEDLEVIARDNVLAALPLRTRRAAQGAVRLQDLAPTGIEAVDRTLRVRLATRGLDPALRSVSRSVRVEDAVAEVLRAEGRLGLPTSATLAPEVMARAVAAAVASRHGPRALGDIGALTAAADLVTTARPFLRWDPVLPPAVVPRHPYSEGESLLTLVIRSDVALDDDGNVVVTNPSTFASATVADHPDLVWRGDSQRHLAAPKSSQLEVERHGRLDFAFGSDAVAADRKRALATSLREAGTFLDRRIAHRTNPGKTVKQPGLELHHTPTADPEALVTLDDIDARRGTPLAPGQYVVHNVDRLVLPYLADPLADGASLVFPDAGRDHRLDVPFAIEGVRLPFEGDWPDPVPHRLVLEDGDRLSAQVDDHVITVAVPPGEHLRMRLSTCLTSDALALLGLWRGLPQAYRDRPEIAEAAVDGWLWWLTPADEVRLVHAVRRPVERPRVPALFADRREGDTTVSLLGVVDVHGPSTERLDVEAAWTEPVDDPAKPACETVARQGIAGDTAVGYGEDLVLFGDPGDEGEALAFGDGREVISHAISHAFDDTRHRLVDYTVRATSRYREFFPPAVFPAAEDFSLTSEPVRLSILSSARPPKPVVRDVLPLFRWDEESEPQQPFGARRTRRTGLRIYLDRPWYATGEGELLGIVLAGGGEGPVRNWTSQWAADPIWRQEGPQDAADLPLVDELDLYAYDGIIEAGRPVAAPARLPLVDLPGNPEVRVLGYQPEYSPQRRLWFVDVAFDPATAFWPFVRLALVRYQPASRGGLHLSPVVVCDFAQLAPERIATLTRPDADHVRVIVTGAVGERSGDLQPGRRGEVVDRLVLARLEQRDAALDSDLAWVTRAVEVLPVRGRDGQMVSWNGTLALPDSLAPGRPGSLADWRVTVEEWEMLPADGETPEQVTREGRLIYADHLPL